MVPVPGNFRGTQHADGFVRAAIALGPFVDAFKDPSEMMAAIVAINKARADHFAVIQERATAKR